MINTTKSRGVMVGGTSLMIPGVTRVGPLAFKFNDLIKMMFRNNEQGFAYDPNDLSTMFQDAAGTIPVTAADQPVGLMLDKSKGLELGAEKLVNGDFSNGSANWQVSGADATHLVTFTDGKARFQSDTMTPVLHLGQAGVLVSGKWYEVTIACSNHISGSLKMDVGNGAPIVVTGVGMFKTKILANYTVFGVVRNSTNVDLTIDSISVKEIVGNHAYQSVSASRPILQQTPILGNELVVGGGFGNGTAYPFDIFTTSNGGFSAKNTTSKIGGAVSNTVLNVTAGVTYAIEFDLIYSLDGRALSVRLVHDKSGAGSGGNSGINTSKLGKNIINYTPSVSGSFYLQFNNGGAAISDYRVENISMKEVTGYRTDQKYLKFDGVDDKLTTTLPTQLTGCTVIRSVPNVGTQILTNQTIPTTYNGNIDNCGLIVINRALTASETSQITKLFNKAAGV